MSKPYSNLLSSDFLPLSEVKARLSEQLRRVRDQGRRLMVTVNGKPEAVLMSYSDYLNLLRRLEDMESPAELPALSYETWKAGEKTRKEVSASLNRMFDAPRLSRKGQKSYKARRVGGPAIAKK